MNDDQFYEFGICGLALGLAFATIQPLKIFIAPALTIFALLGVFFTLKGTAEFLLGQGTRHLWIGISFCLMVALFFNSTGTVMNVFNGFLNLAAALINTIF